MTVESVDLAGMKTGYLCLWFAVDKDRQRRFVGSVLKPAELELPPARAED